MIKDIRDFFGFTQLLLASILRVTRSQLNMAERGERSLPLDADSVAMKLFLAIPGHGVVSKEGSVLHELVNKHIDIEKQRSRNVAYTRHSKCKRAVTKAEEALIELKEKKSRCMEMFSALSHLVDKIPEQEKFTFIERHILIKQYECGMDQQIKMEARILGMKAEMEFLENHFPVEVYDLPPNERPKMLEKGS